MNSFPAEMTTEMAQQLMQNAKVIAKSLSDGTLPAAMAGTMNPNEIASLAAYEVDSPEFWEGMWTNLYVYYSQNEGSRALAKLGLQADKAGHVSQTNYVKFWGTLLETPTLASTNPKIAGYKHRIREFAALSRKYSTHSFAHYNNVSRVCILLGVKLQRNYVEEFEIASLDLQRRSLLRELALYNWNEKKLSLENGLITENLNEILLNINKIEKKNG